MDFLKAKAAHLRLGARGEKAACRLLRAKGLEILARDFKTPRGEIDIVARDGSTIVFVEVKTKRASSRSRPAENLKSRQKARIYRAALWHLKKIGSPELPFRFDIVEMLLGSWGPVQAWHWPAAFGQEALLRRRRPFQ
jgi:putative endonuclease